MAGTDAGPFEVEQRSCLIERASFTARASIRRTDGVVENGPPIKSYGQRPDEEASTQRSRHDIHDTIPAPAEQARSMVITTAVCVAVLYTIADRVIEDVFQITAEWGQLLEVVIMGAMTSIVLWIGVLRPLHRHALIQRDEAVAREQDLEFHAAQQRFEGQLHRALEMASTEDSAYRATQKGLYIALGDGQAEVLLADSSDAHLKRAVMLGEPACGVATPHDCPAIRRSQTLQFRSSGALDACPHLDGRPSGPCGAVCVPLSVGGRSIGVLHAVTPDDRPFDDATVNRLESISTQAGSRIGMLRVMSATTLQAATDPLTGLLNRRSFENRTHAMLRHHRPFALAMGDLDHFKRVNDTHGHDAGDRALRLFTRVLTSSLRAEDIISRYGGEEFVIVFPDQTASQAAAALRRMQEELIVALSDGTVPGFTVSYGVTDSAQSSELEELCRIADSALFRAKRSGRNRVTIDPSPDQELADMTSEHLADIAD